MINFDPTSLDLPEPIDPQENYLAEIDAMKRFYPDAKEAILDNAPSPGRRSNQINAFVDADHAGSWPPPLHNCRLNLYGMGRDP